MLPEVHGKHEVREMQDMDTIADMKGDDDVIVLLQDSFGEPHERVRTTFEDVEALRIYKHHHMTQREVAHARVEFHELRSAPKATA